MADAPKKKLDRKELLRRAARELPAPVLAYGIGYGIARTALDRFFANPANAAKYTPTMQRYVPLALAAGAAYTGHELSRLVRQRLLEDKP